MLTLFEHNFNSAKLTDGLQGFLGKFKNFNCAVKVNYEKEAFDGFGMFFTELTNCRKECS